MVTESSTQFRVDLTSFTHLLQTAEKNIQLSENKDLVESTWQLQSIVNYKILLPWITLTNITKNAKARSMWIRPPAWNPTTPISHAMTNIAAMT